MGVKARWTAGKIVDVVARQLRVVETSVVGDSDASIFVTVVGLQNYRPAVFQGSGLWAQTHKQGDNKCEKCGT